MAEAQRMPTSSKIVVDGLEFQDALASALAVAPNKEPEDVIQFRVADGRLHIGARDTAGHVTLSAHMDTSMADIVADRDEAFEVTKLDAKSMASMKMKADEEEPDPLVGLIVTEKHVTRTDETGLSLGIRQARVRRSHHSQPLVLGEVNTIGSAASGFIPLDQGARLTAHQRKVLAKVAAKDDLNHFAIAPGEAFSHRVLTLGHGLVAYTAIPDPNYGEDDNDDGGGSDGPAPTDPLNFDDTHDLRDAVTDLRDKMAERGASFTVVGANPPGGIA